MKKFFKWFTITILIVACVAGTCYFFFKNLTDKEHCFSYIGNYLYSASEEELDAKIKTINGQTNGRFNTHIKTKENLNEIAFTLTTYLASANKKDVDNTKIVNSFSSVDSARFSTIAIADEFSHKLANSNFFDKNVGANDLYIGFAGQLVQYANSLKILNGELDKLQIDKSADIKFSMIDAYLNVTINSFTNIKRTNNVAYLDNFANINLMNQHFKLQNSVLRTNQIGTYFSFHNNSFIKYYNDCDKEEFSKNIANLVGSVNGFNADQTNTQNAVYFFKVIYGI